MATHPDQGDFPTFYLTSVKMRYAEKVYWSPSEGRLLGQGCDAMSKHLTLDQMATDRGSQLARMIPCQLVNLNSPFMISLMAPIAYLDYVPAWLIWSLLSLACLALMARKLIRACILPSITEKNSMLFWAGYFFYVPTMANVLLGQVTFLVLLPVVVGWLRLREGFNWSAGVWLGLAISVKLFVGLFFVGLVFEKNWRALTSLVITSLICFAFGGFVLGFDAYSAYSSVLERIDWQSASWNASLAGIFSRLQASQQTMAWLEEVQIGRHALWLVTSFLVCLYGYGVHISSSCPRDYRADILCAMTIPLMLLISPLGWIYYFPMLLVTVLVLGRECPHARRYFKIGFVVSLALTAIPSHLVPAEEMKEPHRWFGVSLVYPCGLLGLFALTLSSVIERTNNGSFLTKTKRAVG
jgi:hypothetical protein